MVVNGTTYKHGTPQQVIDIIERARETGRRIRVHYGDAETGRDWGDQYDVTGTVGRSLGPEKVPLLIHNSRSRGGGAMLTACIVRIRPASRDAGGDLYRHPSYQPPKREDVGMTEQEYERHFS